MEKRPFSVLFLILMPVFFAAWNGLRLGEAIFFWRTLEKYGVHPIYFAISGAVWIIAGLLIAWSLWLGKSWAWTATIGGVAGYTAWYWVDRLAIQKPHANWPFVLAGNLVFLLVIFAILFSKNTRHFLKRDTNDRKPKSPTIA